MRPTPALLAAILPLVLAPAASGQQTPGRPSATSAAYDATTAKAAIAALAGELEANFVFPDVARRYAAMLRTKLAAGGYDGFADRVALTQAMTADLQAVAPDGHLAMHASEGPAPAAASAPRAVAPPPMEQAGWIAPGIAFVRFNTFFGELEVLKAFTAFLDTHAGAKTLIIDARTHRGGGLAEMDVLFPRLFDRAQTVMVMDTRASIAATQRPLPFASLVQVAAPDTLHRTEHRVTPQRPASPWARTKVYVLTSGRTASAAEHLTQALKESGRATIVGDTTAGAGHYGGTAELPGGYSAFIPGGRSYFPGKSGWEGTGVSPTIRVAPERAMIEVLIREGLSPAEAERLSEIHKPVASMERRRPLRP